MRRLGRWMLLADGSKVGLTSHAIARYQERVTSGLELPDAQRHMVRLAAELGRYADCPAWLTHDHARAGTRFVTLGPDVVLLVAADGDVVTVVARGGLTPAQQLRRRSRRQARRARSLGDRHPKIVRAEARRRRRAPKADEDAA